MKIDVEQVAQNVVSGMIMKGGANFASPAEVRKYAREYGWDAEIDEFGPDGIDKRSDKQDDAINKRIAEIIAAGIPKSRSRRKIFYSSPSTGETLTEMQVNFIRQLFQIDAYDPEAYTPIEHIVDNIEGQFTDRPTTIGAAISTLREKGVIQIALKRVDKRNMKSIAFTDKGKQILSEVIS